jgi:hypothetical protein
VPKWVGNSAKRAKSILPRQGSNLRPPSTGKRLKRITARCNYHCATKNSLFCFCVHILYRAVSPRSSLPQLPHLPLSSVLDTTLDCSIYGLIIHLLCIILYVCAYFTSCAHMGTSSARPSPTTDILAISTQRDNHRASIAPRVYRRFPQINKQVRYSTLPCLQCWLYIVMYRKPGSGQACQ